MLNNQVFRDHLKTIDYEARMNYPRYMYDDLVQEGYLGLIRAIRNFNPDKKIKLITYAIYYIRSYMLQYYKKNHRPYEYLDEDLIGKYVDFIQPIFQEQVLSRLPDAIGSLDAREQDIITSRYLNEESEYLHVLGTKYGVSEERTRQIEAKALLKLRRNIE